MEKYIIGIDAGTSGIKAVLFDLAGNEVRKMGYPIEAHCPIESWYEEDPAEIWDKAQKAIRSVVEPFP